MWQVLTMTEFCKPLSAQRGASLVEFSIVGLSVILVGLFSLQMGFLYHAKTTLNYAVFEAARTGAVNNASMSSIRSELGIRLAPLEGGDGSYEKALLAMTKSVLRMNDPFNTKVTILNPTLAAFKDWSIKDPDTGKRFIPVNHLRHQRYDIGPHSGLSLRDATILKLQVVHGVDLRVPIVGKLMALPMQWLDAANAVYYLRGKWPIQSVATVRMQSDAFEEEILKSANNDKADSSGEGDGPIDVAAAGPATDVDSGPKDELAGGLAGGMADESDPEPDREQGDEEDSGDRADNTDEPQDEPDNEVAQGGQADPQAVDEDETGPDFTDSVEDDTSDIAQGSPATDHNCEDNVLVPPSVAAHRSSSPPAVQLMSTSRYREILAQQDK